MYIQCTTATQQFDYGNHKILSAQPQLCTVRNQICMCARFRRCNESNKLFQLIVTVILPLT